MRMRTFLSISAGAARLGTLVLLSLLMLSAALADEADPPGRVARLSYLQGSVSLQPAGSQDWIPAELNRPLTTSDRLWSDNPGSRAELDIGGAVIRLGSQTGFSFLNLDDNIAQMQVSAGTVVVHVRELLENQTYEIDTPNLAVLLDQPGQYRVDVSQAGDTTVVRVSDGHAEASSGGETIQIDNQEMTTFMGTDQVSVLPATLGAPDGFDGWSFERDREFDQAVSRQYVAQDMAGAEDLDDNGQWQNTPDYGPVWVPTAVATGWAPYSFGHWAWIAPWGWTWVDDAPWGFAPFHYGRWGRWHNSWCWIPGPRQVRPVYAPAMVAWVGGGGGAHVGWFPLGPREVFVPGYRVSDRYVRTINITNTTITDRTYISNVYQSRGANLRYANSGVPGAVTTVPQNVFASAQPVNSHRVNFPEGQGGRLATTAAPPAIAPVPQNVMRGGIARRPPPAVLNRVVVARTPLPTAPGVRVRMVAPPTQQPNREREFNGQGFNRPGTALQPSRPPMQQARPLDSQLSRPSAPQVESPVRPRPGVVMPSPPAAGDSRSWAERERALEHSSLPSTPAQAPAPREYNGQGFRPGQGVPQQRSNEVEQSSQGGASRDAPPSWSSRPGQVEQERPPTNSYVRPQVESRPQQENRPQFEGRPIEERRQFEERQSAPAIQEAPVPHFTAPPPPPASVPHFTAPPPPPASVPHFTAPPPPPASVPGSPPAPARPVAPPPQQHAPSANHPEERPSQRAPARSDPR